MNSPNEAWLGMLGQSELPAQVCLCLSDPDMRSVYAARLASLGIGIRHIDTVAELASIAAPAVDLLIADSPGFAGVAVEALGVATLTIATDADELIGDRPCLPEAYPIDEDLRDALWFAMIWYRLRDVQVPLVRLLFSRGNWVMAVDEGFSRVELFTPGAESPWFVAAQDLQEHPERLMAAVHAEDRARVQRSYERLHQQTTSHATHLEYRVIAPDGRLHWVQERLLRLPAGAQGVRRLLSVASDITQRRYERNRLLEASGLGTDPQVLDLITVGIEELDNHGRVVYANLAACEILGRAERHVLGSEPAAFAEGDAAAAIRETLGRLLAPDNRDEDACSLVTPCTRADGQLAQIRRDMRVVRTPHGTPVGCCSVLTDVTHELRRARELRESARLSQVLLENIPFSAVLVDDQGTVLAANRDTHVEAPFPAAWREPWDTAGLRQPRVRTRQEVVIDDRVWEMQWVPVDARTALNLALDITDQWHHEKSFRALVDSISTPIGQDFFDNLVKSLALWLHADGAMVVETKGEYNQATAFYWRGEYIQDYSYQHRGSPCQVVSREGYHYVPADADSRYPQDTELARFGIKGYVGVRLGGENDETQGILCAVHSSPLHLPPNAEDVCRILASRASAELEHRRADQALAQAASELEERVAARTREISTANARLQLYRRIDTTIAEILHLSHSQDDLRSMMDLAVATFIRLPGLGFDTSMALHLLSGDQVVPSPITTVPQGLTRSLILPDDLAVLKRSEHPEARMVGDEWHYTIPVWADESPIALILARRPYEKSIGPDELVGLSVAARALGVVIHDALMQEALRGMQVDLRRSERFATLGKLAGGIAQDFSNQLTQIVGAASLLAGNPAYPQEVAETAERILASASDLGRITANLLPFSPDALLHVTEFDLRNTVDAVVESLIRTTAPGIRIRDSRPETPVRILGDEGQIMNAILNIATNSIAAMSAGGQLSIDLELRDFLSLQGDMPTTAESVSGMYVVVTIADTGTGIPPEDVARVFDPGHSTKPGSYGMGLAVVQRVVEDHQGIVDLRSNLGQGTTVRLALPHKPSVTTEGTRIEHSDTMPSATIMVVDDRAIVRQVVVDCLGSLGHECIPFASPLEAIDYYTEHWRDVDILILDLIMPELSGVELFGRVRQVNPQAAVVIASGYADRDGGVRTLLDSGGCLFLNKPFTPDELKSVTDRALTGGGRPG